VWSFFGFFLLNFRDLYSAHKIALAEGCWCISLMSYPELGVAALHCRAVTLFFLFSPDTFFSLIISPWLFLPFP